MASLLNRCMKIKVDKTKAPRRIKPIKRRCIEEKIRIGLNRINVQLKMNRYAKISVDKQHIEETRLTAAMSDDNGCDTISVTLARTLVFRGIF